MGSCSQPGERRGCCWGLKGQPVKLQNSGIWRFLKVFSSAECFLEGMLVWNPSVEVSYQDSGLGQAGEEAESTYLPVLGVPEASPTPGGTI